MASTVATSFGALEGESGAHWAVVGMRTVRLRTAQMAGLGERVLALIVKLGSVRESAERALRRAGPKGIEIRPQ